MWRRRDGLGDLALVGVTVGPGSFTGIRIGLAAARGMALAGRFRLAGIGTCEAIAHASSLEERRGRTLLVAVDSKRSDLFVQAFAADLRPLGPPAGMTAAEAVLSCPGPLLLAGDAAGQLLVLCPDALVSKAPPFPDARIVARLAEDQDALGRALPPRPIYLRPPDVTLPAAFDPSGER